MRKKPYLCSMKRNILILFTCLCAYVSAYAGVTTYEFKNIKWASQVGATPCDGKTDGWTCDKEASEYMTGRTDAQGRLYSQGVSVKTGTSGAGATSVKSFTNVRRIDFNFCQNASKGRGIIYVQVGDNPYDSIVVTKPATSGSGVYMRDSIVRLSTPYSGKIRFWISCTENAINLNAISIRAEEGGSNPFTQATYQLVTDVEQLQDSDLVIFGVADGVTNKIMGYYDPEVSKNNIHAVAAKYAHNRTEVEANEEMAYLFHYLPEPGGTNGVWYIEDVGYGDLFLVADGGRTKNKLTLWDKIESPSYGNFGMWTITVADDGAAIVENQGTSERKFMQYNATDQLFGCYADKNSQTKVALYRYTEAIGTDEPAIAAPMVNFGNVPLRTLPPYSPTPLPQVESSKTIEVNANKLTEDISAQLKEGSIFSLSASTLDRDGDQLTISFSASEEGRYVDTLVLSSTGVVKQVPVMVNVIGVKTVAEAVQANDFDMIYLNDVVVTKKYDKYIFVRDETGSMLIYDTENPTTGKPYGQGLENGHVLTNVQGRFKNYYGVPEITPTAAWSVAAQKQTCLPEVVEKVDSSDVCRYITVTPSTIHNPLSTIHNPQSTIVDAFNTGIYVDEEEPFDAVVMIVHDELQLWIVAQKASTPIDTPQSTAHHAKYIKNGQVVIEHKGLYFTPLAQPQ